jgi:hypothetical protein
VPHPLFPRQTVKAYMDQVLGEPDHPVKAGLGKRGGRSLPSTVTTLAMTTEARWTPLTREPLTMTTEVLIAACLVTTTTYLLPF